MPTIIEVNKTPNGLTFMRIQNDDGSLSIRAEYPDRTIIQIARPGKPIIEEVTMRPWGERVGNVLSKLIPQRKT